MQYMIQGRPIRAAEIMGLKHEDFIALVFSRVQPALLAIRDAMADRRVLAFGSPAGSRDVVMVVDFRAETSHRCVREFLMTLPIFEYYDWQVTPLETLDDLMAQFGARG